MHSTSPALSAASGAPDASALMTITARPPEVMQRGEGSYLYDEAGKRYLDFIQGWAVNALGHSPPEIVGALTAQAATLISPSPALHNRPQHDVVGAFLIHLRRASNASTPALVSTSVSRRKMS